MKAFISLRFIHNQAKNLTSSTVFAFKTMNHKKLHPTISHISNIILINHNICHFDNFLVSFFSTNLSINLVFKNNFSQKLLGTVFVIISKFFSSMFIHQFHS